MKKYLTLFVVALTSISVILGFSGWSAPNGTGTSYNADTGIICQS